MNTIKVKIKTTNQKISFLCDYEILSSLMDAVYNPLNGSDIVNFIWYKNMNDKISISVKDVISIRVSDTK